MLTAKVDSAPERQASNGDLRSVERIQLPINIEPKRPSEDLELRTTNPEDSWEYYQAPTIDSRSNTAGDGREPLEHGDPSLLKSESVEAGANIKPYFDRRQTKEAPGTQSVIVGQTPMKKRPGRNGEPSHERCRKARKGHDVSLPRE